MNQQSNSQRNFIKKICQFMIENEDDAPSSFEEYELTCNMNGVKCSFEDDNFVSFVFMKLGEYSNNGYYLNIVKSALNKFKILNPIKNKIHEEIISAIMEVEIVRHHEIYSMIGDYVIKNYPETPVGKLAIRYAKTFGITGLSWDEVYHTNFRETVIKMINKDSVKNNSNVANNVKKRKVKKK